MIIINKSTKIKLQKHTKAGGYMTLVMPDTASHLFEKRPANDRELRSDDNNFMQPLLPKPMLVVDNDGELE